MSKWLEEFAAEHRRAEATKENLLRSIQSNEEEIRSFEDTRASYKAQIQAHLNAVHMLYRMEGQILCRIGDVQKSINELQMLQCRFITQRNGYRKTLLVIR